MKNMWSVHSLILAIIVSFVWRVAGFEAEIRTQDLPVRMIQSLAHLEIPKKLGSW
jgi:hypothetical protein